MILHQPYSNNYPFKLDTRIDEINIHQEELIFQALSIHSQFLNLPFHFESFIQEFHQLQLSIKEQEGFAPLAFPYFKSLVERPSLNKRNQSVSLEKFLTQDNHLYPMNLKRDNDITIYDIKDELYISCIYVLNSKRELIIAPFNSQVVNLVWYDRNTHADLLFNEKSLAAGVMYFDKNNKSLLFINNASGHYRTDLISSMINMKEILEKFIDIKLTRFSSWSDVEFKNNIALNSL